MKILRIIPTMNPESGGPCQGIRNSIPVMKTFGVDTEVVCFDDPQKKYYDDFKIHKIGPSKGRYSFCPNLKSWLLSNMHRFDVLIIHGLWLYNSFGTYRVWNKLKSKGLKVPKLFVMPHGMLDPYFQKAKGRKIKALRNNLFWKFFEFKVVNFCDGILFTCQQELELAKKSFNNYNPKLTLNVSYGVSPPPKYDSLKMKKSFNEQSKIRLPKKYLLFLSRIHQKKGLDILIKAYKEVINSGCLLPPLVIAGPGLETDYGKKLLGLVKGEENIFFTGMLKGDAKWEAFYNAEAFILPSHQENFGIAVAEALACRKPVLISKQVNIWEEIIKAGGGFVCDDSEQDIKRMLIEWSHMLEKNKMELGNKAYECFKERFSVANATQIMYNQIRSVL